MNQIRIPEWIFSFILTTFLLDIVLNGYYIDIDTVLMEVKGFKNIYIYIYIYVQALQLEKKQLTQQWYSSLIGMRRRDEAYAAMQEALR